MRIFEIGGICESQRNSAGPLAHSASENDFDSRPRLTLGDLHKMRLKRDREREEKKQRSEFLPRMYGMQGSLTTNQWVELEMNRRDNQTDLEIERLKVLAGIK